MQLTSVHPCFPFSNTYRESIWLKRELDSGLVPEVALVVVAMRPEHGPALLQDRTRTLIHFVCLN
jgi:hypothetical protein